MPRDQNGTDFLTSMHLPAIFQRLTLSPMFEFVNEHKNYFDRLIFVVNFDALAQASDIQIERKQVVFLC